MTTDESCKLRVEKAHRQTQRLADMLQKRDEKKSQANNRSVETSERPAPVIARVSSSSPQAGKSELSQPEEAEAEDMTK